uniref:Uncharacterized protein n=1 Tax=Anguilla anguilla TaxID=7936 RepID=A0A0E9VZB9_ANGAN
MAMRFIDYALARLCMGWEQPC